MKRSGMRGTELDLADRFYFLTHDVNGGARLHQRAIDYGLAASLIGELLLSGWAAVDFNTDPFAAIGVLSALDRRAPAPADFMKQQAGTGAVLRPLWRELVAEPWRHPLRTWLEFAARNADSQVTARLITAGHLTRDRKRQVAVDTVTGNLPSARLWAVLSQMQAPDVEDAALLGIADAAGLRQYLLDGLDPANRPREFLDWFLGDLPNHRPDLVELATHTAAAVGASVLTQRH